MAWPTTPKTIPNPDAGPSRPFLGKGLASPLREDPVTGDFQRVEDEENVRQCIRDGLLTAIGERVMNETIGTIARDLIFEESDVVSTLLEPSVRDFFDRHEPRVVLNSVTVKNTSLDASLAAFKVTVIYVIIATNKRSNLVFPFYLAASQAPGS